MSKESYPKISLSFEEFQKYCKYKSKRLCGMVGAKSKCEKFKCPALIMSEKKRWKEQVDEA